LITMARRPLRGLFAILFLFPALHADFIPAQQDAVGVPYFRLQTGFFDDKIGDAAGTLPVRGVIAQIPDLPAFFPAGIGIR